MPDEVTAACAWNLLREQGVYVNLALPPGTPNSLCLLRCSVSAAHSLEQIDEIVRRFGTVMEGLARVGAGRWRRDRLADDAAPGQPPEHERAPPGADGAAPRR